MVMKLGENLLIAQLNAERKIAQRRGQNFAMYRVVAKAGQKWPSTINLYSI